MSDNRVFKFAMNCSVIVALLLSLSNLGMILLRGGVFLAEFRALQHEVAQMKAEGSPRYAEHIKLDDFRQKTSDEHFQRVDTFLAVIPSIDKKLSLIEQKMDSLQRGLDEHKEQTRVTTRMP